MGRPVLLNSAKFQVRLKKLRKKMLTTAKKNSTQPTNASFICRINFNAYLYNSSYFEKKKPISVSRWITLLLMYQFSKNSATIFLHTKLLSQALIKMCILYQEGEDLNTPFIDLFFLYIFISNKIVYRTYVIHLSSIFDQNYFWLLLYAFINSNNETMKPIWCMEEKNQLEEQS